MSDQQVDKAPEEQMKDASVLREKYLRKGMFPTIFCNGCGHGVALDYIFWAIEELGMDMDKVVFASGIELPCNSWLPVYQWFLGFFITRGFLILRRTVCK